MLTMLQYSDINVLISVLQKEKTFSQNAKIFLTDSRVNYQLLQHHPMLHFHHV